MTTVMNMLQDEICLVTGASRGIGQAIALALGAAGATVVGTATSDSGAENITNYLKDKGMTGVGMALDVTQDNSVTQVTEAINSQYGPVSVLVNNAGITRDGLLMRMKDEDWDAVLDTNLKSVYRVTKACLRGMTKARKGRVINIASVVAASGNPGQCNYAAAKAGMLGFTRSLAQELGGRGITVNGVAPGFIDTDMTRALNDEQRNQLLQHIPLGRLGQPDDIAAVVVFLASPGAAYITGATVHVNGGMYMA